jgi:hypothetical protein
MPALLPGARLFQGSTEEGFLREHLQYLAADSNLIQDNADARLLGCIVRGRSMTACGLRKSISFLLLTMINNP